MSNGVGTGADRMRSGGKGVSSLAMSGSKGVSSWAMSGSKGVSP